MAIHPNVSPAEGSTRRDWSTEITPEPARAAGQARPASDTGLGGIRRDRTEADPAPVSGANAVTGGTGGGSRTASGLAGSLAEQADTASGDWITRAPAGTAGWRETLPGMANGDSIGQDIENNMPPEEIGAPDTLEEVYRGSMKALLLRNIGNYVVATFLIGTQATVSWEGILYDVGNDYLAIYQTGRDQYIVSDLYSLKYVEFYDTRRRQMCDALLEQQGPAAQ